MRVVYLGDDSVLTKRSTFWMMMIICSTTLPVLSAFTFHPPSSLLSSPLSLSSFSSATKVHPFTSSSRLSISSSSSNTVSDEISLDLLPGIFAIDSMNDDLEAMLQKLREEPFFRLYSVDILGSCEYMPQEMLECYSESCEIYPVDDDEIPSDIQSIDADEHGFELDGWARWDMPTEDYYDTTQFPEEYTGYDGSMIWNFIHSKICFQDVNEEDEDWKADFNRAVSGLHSMISTNIVRGIEYKLMNDELDDDNQWNDPKVEYERRLSPNGETKHAVDNLYFGYMLLLSAVVKARERLLQDCASNKIVSQELIQVLSHPLLNEPTNNSINVASLKLHDHAIKDADATSALWEARMRTRELMRIMNCVQCNKCRLHGKIAVLGLSTAMQVLVGRTGEGEDLNRIHRVELAALMTTMSKFSTAIKYCQKMSR